MAEAQKEFIVVDREKRFGFVDQFRGIVILLFVIADITWSWSGDILGGVLPVGPTWLNHGWKFYDYPAKELITLIDIGQMLFVFVMGLMLPMTWRSHKEHGGTGYAIGQLLIRLGWFYLIAGVMDEFDLKAMFLTNTFAVLAASMVVATLVAAIVKDPNIRFYVNIVLMGALTVLYALPDVKTGLGSIFGLSSGIEVVPLNLLGASIVAIQGGIFMEWFTKAKETPDDALKRIMKMSTIMYVACFLIDYFWWADHKAMNTSLVLMSIGSGGFLFVIFRVFEDRFKFTIPGLNPFGRNTLLAFMLALPFQLVVWDLLGLADNFKAAPWPIAPLMSIVSIVLMFAMYYAVLVPFDRKQWYFTPSIFVRAIKYGKAKKRKE
jgi:hypothetical protein